MARPRKKHIQLTLDSARKPKGHGGWRPNAGRPKGRNVVAHDVRVAHKARFPVHVTLRLCADVPSLAREAMTCLLHDAIEDSQKPTFRIVEFNFLSNHIHLITEASSTSELSRGVQGFAGRVARRVNRRFARTGKVFAARFHARELKTPRDVRNTVRYVLLNRKHHDVKTFEPTWIDPYSSAPWFTGWAATIEGPAWKMALVHSPAPTRPAETWLLTTGWLRLGRLRFDEKPSRR